MACHLCGDYLALVYEGQKWCLSCYHQEQLRRCQADQPGVYSDFLAAIYLPADEARPVRSLLAELDEDTLARVGCMACDAVLVTLRDFNLYEIADHYGWTLIEDLSFLCPSCTYHCSRYLH